MKNTILILALLIFIVAISCTKTKNSAGSNRCSCGWQIKNGNDTTIIYSFSGTQAQVDSQCVYKRELYLDQHGITADCQLMY